MRTVTTAVQDDMARPPVDTVQVTFRIPTPWLIEADEVADLLSRPGHRLSRTDAMRAALAKGFEALRGEHESLPAKGVVKQTRKTLPDTPKKR